MSDKLIATPEELELLFPIFEQREIFIRVMTRLISVIDRSHEIPLCYVPTRVE